MIQLTVNTHTAAGLSETNRVSSTASLKRADGGSIGADSGAHRPMLVLRLTDLKNDPAHCKN